MPTEGGRLTAVLDVLQDHTIIKIKNEPFEMSSRRSSRNFILFSEDHYPDHIIVKAISNGCT